MKSFLLKDNTPIIKWGTLPDNVFYEGIIPKGYDLAVAPNQPYIVIDIDRHGKKDGFEHIHSKILDELETTFHYSTKQNGVHYWCLYTGGKTLINKASGLGIDLRIGSVTINKNEYNCGGYVKWHPRDTLDIRYCINSIKETSHNMNIWIESLFS